MTNSPPPDLQGKTIAGRYLVERLIGQGGMGTVWAGRHVSLDQLVAIKFVHPKLAGSSEALRRFDTEAKAAARIKSRHAVAVYDHGVEAGQPYIVMEYLEGESLEQSIARRGKLPLHEVAEIVQQAARALHAAHQAGIVHRDLKPDNIFLARDGEAGTRGYSVKLLDFGIAKMVHEEAAGGASSTQAGMVLGTPHYMSPEALTASAPVSAASDIWSLGACAFSAACGRVPFEGEAIGDVVLKVCAAPMPVPSQIQLSSLPKAFDAWFERACSREPKRRFTSVVELADALVRLDEWARAQRERVLYEIRPMAPSIVDTGELDLQPSSRGRLLAGLLVGASLMLGVLGLYVFKRTREADEAVRQATASAAAVVEADNQRKLREAEKQFWAADAGSAAHDAGKPPAVHRVPPKKKHP